MQFIINNPDKTSPITSFIVGEPHSIGLTLKKEARPLFLKKLKELNGSLTEGISINPDVLVLITTKPREKNSLALQEVFTHFLGEKDIHFLMKIISHVHYMQIAHISVFKTLLIHKFIQLRAWDLEKACIHFIAKLQRSKRTGKYFNVPLLSSDIYTMDTIYLPALKYFQRIFHNIFHRQQYSAYDLDKIKRYRSLTIGTPDYRIIIDENFDRKIQIFYKDFYKFFAPQLQIPFFEMSARHGLFRLKTASKIAEKYLEDSLTRAHGKSAW